MTQRTVVITVAGELSDALCGEFDDVEVLVGNSVTRIRLPKGDASMLLGVIHRLEAHGLELLDVHDEPQ